MPSIILTREEVRRVDQLAIDQLNISSLVLMENAGRGAAEIIAKLASPSTGTGGKVFILCGKGNNGGDGLVVARQLAILGIPAETLVLGRPEDLSPDSHVNWQIGQRLGLPISTLTAVDSAAQEVEGRQLLESFLSSFGPSDWLVDGLLGTGSTSAPRGLIAVAIRAVNQNCPKVIALDLPSGLDANTGVPFEPTIHAQICLTFAANKPGLITWQQGPGRQLHVIHIGIPDSFLNQVKSHSP